MSRCRKRKMRSLRPTSRWPRSLVPWRLSEHKRALGHFNVAVKNTKKGSHPWKAVGKDKTGRDRKFPFVAHKGLQSEIDDVYIPSLCTQFGLDEAEYRAHLK